MKLKIIDDKGRLRGRLFRCNLIDLIVIILAIGYIALCISWGIESLRGKGWRDNIKRSEYTRGWNDKGMGVEFEP